MPLNSEIREEQRVAEVTELAIGKLAADLNVTVNEATRMLFISVGRNLTPAAVNESIRTIQSRKGVPLIA